MLMKLSTGSAPSVASNKPTCDMALLRYRYYNQSVGRFTSFDDFAGHSTHPQSLNKYGYANGDPINVFDPSGHDGISFETLAVLGITSSFMFGWAYFTGHRTIETDFRPNWADAVGDVAHSHHRVTLAFPQTKLTANQIADQIFADLRRFNYFNVDNDNNSNARPEGNLVYFEPLGFFGYLSGRINPIEVAVQIVNGPGQREISAMTLGSHMLVGIRRWRVIVVSQNPPTLRVETEAYEQSNGRSNQMGRAIMGQDRQYEVWTNYLNNIADHWVGTNNAESSGVSFDPIEDVGTVNPWRQQLPKDLQ